MWWWGPDWGWVGILIGALFWMGVILLAAYLLRGELPHLQHRLGASPPVRLLEERYARGEISREEFLERRAVLSRTPPPEEPPGTEPTEPLPPTSS
jgi:putative membrane protein